jgi:hypothetical protein
MTWRPSPFVWNNLFVQAAAFRVCKSNDDITVHRFQEVTDARDRSSSTWLAEKKALS